MIWSLWTGRRAIIDEPRDFDENALHHGTRKPSARRNWKLTTEFGRLAGSRLIRDLAARPLSRRGQILRELREIRIDLARFSDELPT